jgi:hypothetical protein
MSKRKAPEEPEPPRWATAQDATIPPWLKATLSVVLALHVAAVFIAPFAFACRIGGTSSPFADALHSAFRPYTGAMFLDHGYFFFAPDPGPTHAVEYKVEFDDGRPPIEGEFPSLDDQWPRLLYHRHFMMAEELYNRFAPPEPPPEPSPPPLGAPPDDRARYQQQRTAYQEFLVRWKHDRRAYEAMRESIEEHLRAVHGGDQVTLTRIERRPLRPDEVRVLEWSIDEPQTRRTLPETLPADEGP